MAAATKVLEKRGSEERRTQAERRSEAERALLKAGVGLVADKGLDRFTLADVGEAAGYSRGLPAHYFGSKDNFVATLARQIVGDFGRHAALQGTSRRGLARILETCDLYLESSLQSPKVTRALHAVLGEAVTNAALRKAIRDVNSHSVAAIENIIRDAATAGEIRKGLDPKETAILILSQLRGVVAQWLVDPDGIDIHAIKSVFLDNLKRSLAR